MHSDHQAAIEELEAWVRLRRVFPWENAHQTSAIKARVANYPIEPPPPPRKTKRMCNPSLNISRDASGSLATAPAHRTSGVCPTRRANARQCAHPRTLTCASKDLKSLFGHLRFLRLRLGVQSLGKRNTFGRLVPTDPIPPRSLRPRGCAKKSLARRCSCCTSARGIPWPSR